MKDKFSYAILSGGNSKRFGSDKTKAIFKGKPLFEHALELAESISDDVMFISKDSSKYAPHRQSVRYIEDELKQQCPLSGIITAMKNSQHENIFIISVDMPLVTKQIVDIILSGYNTSECEIIMPMVGGKAYTLVAVYKKQHCSDFMVNYNAGKFKLFDIIKRYEVRFISEDELNNKGIDLRRFANINYSEDLILSNDISNNIN